MMETKHTPTPWRTYDGAWSCGEEDMICCKDEGHIATCSNGDHAALIVKAVNAHDELIKDIRYIKDLANAHDAKCLNSDTFNAVRIIALCNEALSKAGEK